MALSAYDTVAGYRRRKTRGVLEDAQNILRDALANRQKQAISMYELNRAQFDQPLQTYNQNIQAYNTMLENWGARNKAANQWAETYVPQYVQMWNNLAGLNNSANEWMQMPMVGTGEMKAALTSDPDVKQVNAWMNSLRPWVSATRAQLTADSPDIAPGKVPRFDAAWTPTNIGSSVPDVNFINRHLAAEEKRLRYSRPRNLNFGDNVIHKQQVMANRREAGKVGDAIGSYTNLVQQLNDSLASTKSDFDWQLHNYGNLYNRYSQEFDDWNKRWSAQESYDRAATSPAFQLADRPYATQEGFPVGDILADYQQDMSPAGSYQTSYPRTPSTQANPIRPASVPERAVWVPTSSSNTVQYGKWVWQSAPVGDPRWITQDDRFAPVVRSHLSTATSGLSGYTGRPQAEPGPPPMSAFQFSLPNDPVGGVLPEVSLYDPAVAKTKKLSTLRDLLSNLQRI